VATADGLRRKTSVDKDKFPGYNVGLGDARYVVMAEMSDKPLNAATPS
jgi:hypothetical protein